MFDWQRDVKKLWNYEANKKIRLIMLLVKKTMRVMKLAVIKIAIVLIAMLITLLKLLMILVMVEITVALAMRIMLIMAKKSKYHYNCLRNDGNTDNNNRKTSVVGMNY